MSVLYFRTCIKIALHFKCPSDIYCKSKIELSYSYRRTASALHFKKQVCYVCFKLYTNGFTIFIFHAIATLYHIIAKSRRTKIFSCVTQRNNISKMHLILKSSLETLPVPLFTKIHYHNNATALLLTLCYASSLSSLDVEI